MTKKLPILIGVTGDAYSGKDSVADYIVTKYGYVKTTFALPLKIICQDLFQLSDDQLYGKKKHIVDTRYDLSPRDILQKVGTDCFRSLYPNVWVDYLMRNAAVENSHVIVSDVRFANEAKAIKDAGGYLWRTVCPNHPQHTEMTEEQKKHPSEQGQVEIPPTWIDAELRADYGDLISLYKLADFAVQKLELI